jgi:hypothetical protein
LEQRLREEVKRLLSEAEQTDRDEDKHYGRSRRGDELSAELGRREERLQQRIVEAKEAMKAGACAETEEKQKDRNSDKSGSQGGGSRRRRRTAVEPKAKAQHNLTDPESRIMKGPNGLEQAYNAQAAPRCS